MSWRDIVKFSSIILLLAALVFSQYVAYLKSNVISIQQETISIQLDTISDLKKAFKMQREAWSECMAVKN